MTPAIQAGKRSPSVALARKTLREGVRRTGRVIGATALETLTSALTRQRRVHTVGIWDLGAWVGGLPHVIEALNASQPTVTFFEVQAALPAGLRSSGSKLKAYAERKLRRKLTSTEKRDARDAMLDDEFFERAERVRRDLGIDYLVAVAPLPLAGLYTPKGKRRTIYFDFFSTSVDRTSLVSVDGLRRLAERAKRPYEMAVGYVVLAAALVALDARDLDFHAEDRGCLFDFNEERARIVPCLRQPRIEDSCLRTMRPKLRGAALAMLTSLDRYTTPAPER